MKKSSRLRIAIGLAALLLAGAGIAFIMLYKKEVKLNQELTVKLKELTRQEQRSVIMQHINAQMEEIANDERRISDEQREEAEEQAMVAHRERQNAEKERRQAEQERQNALIAEKKAIELSELAQNQRNIADQQRLEAEFAKRFTDTLSYRTLARSLANSAITLYSSGNSELADLLAYTAVIFTRRYHGDINSKSIYQALAMTSQNRNVWKKHNGSVMDIAFYDQKSEDFVSCSTYGEVMRHHLDGDKLVSETLIKNPNYDFRDIYIVRDTKEIYAISRSGHLFIFSDDNKYKTLTMNVEKPTFLEKLGNMFVAIGSHGIALFNPQTGTIEKERTLPFKVVSRGVIAGHPVLFDNQGNQHYMQSFDNLKTSKVPVEGQVTAFAESKNTKTKAYGMQDGSICFVDAKGNVNRLRGHGSRISKIKINGKRLFSSSYDGNLNVWVTNLAKIEPLSLFLTNGWILSFTYDLKKTNIWTGDQKGNLTRGLISISVMIERLKKKLHRNLTREEWEYYVGRNVPYEQIIRKEGNS